MNSRTFFIKGPDGRPWVFHSPFDGVWVGDAPGLRTIIRKAGQGYTWHVRRIRGGYACPNRQRQGDAETLPLAVRLSQLSGDFLLPPGTGLALTLAKAQQDRAQSWARFRVAEKAAVRRGFFSRAASNTREKSHV